MAAHLGNGGQDFFEGAAIEVRLLAGIFHVDHVEELQCVHHRIAALPFSTAREKSHMRVGYPSLDSVISKPIHLEQQTRFMRL